MPKSLCSVCESSTNNMKMTFFSFDIRVVYETTSLHVGGLRASSNNIIVYKYRN